MEDNGWRRNKYGGLFNIFETEQSTNEYMNNLIKNAYNKSKKQTRLNYRIERNINDFYNNQNNKYEHLLMLDTNGNILDQKIGNEPSEVGGLKVLSKILTSKKNSLIIAHNHPNDSTFSYQDIESFNRFKSINTIIVVTKNKLYYLSKNNSDKVKIKYLKERYYDIRNNLDKLSKNKRQNMINTCEQLSREFGWRYEIYDR